MSKTRGISFLHTIKTPTGLLFVRPVYLPSISTPHIFSSRSTRVLPPSTPNPQPISLPPKRIKASSPPQPKLHIPATRPPETHTPQTPRRTHRPRRPHAPLPPPLGHRHARPRLHRPQHKHRAARASDRLPLARAASPAGEAVADGEFGGVLLVEDDVSRRRGGGLVLGSAREGEGQGLTCCGRCTACR